MVEVIWSPEAMDDYLSNIGCLGTRWTEREARKFIGITEWTLNLVSRSPERFYYFRWLIISLLTITNSRVVKT
jgi:plasmid stabilization system protein ParE